MQPIRPLGTSMVGVLTLLAVSGALLAGPVGAQGSAGYGYAGSSGSTGSAAPSASRAGAAPTQRVQLAIDDFVFFPAEISFPAGTEITWVNAGRTQHTTTAPGLWDSRPIASGGRWAAMFAVPGTYDYICTIHPDLMQGRLTITAS